MSEGGVGHMLSDSDSSDGDVAQAAPDAGRIGSNLPELSDCPDLLRHSQSAESVGLC